jgi:hypothetical protein
MGMTRVLPALFAAAVFALPATASAQSPTIIIVNPPPAFGNYGGWGPGVGATAWGGGCGAGWGGGCGAGWGGGCGGGGGGGCGVGWGGGWGPGWGGGGGPGWGGGGGSCVWTSWGWRC